MDHSSKFNQCTVQFASSSEESIDCSEGEFIDTDEEEFSAEELDINTSQRLLTFACKISKDIFVYFNNKMDSEDHCDIYENKFTNIASGRDMYYADLLAMAHYGENADSGGITKLANKREKTNRSSKCDWPCSGRRNPDLGLGPLSELFEHLTKNQMVLNEKRFIPQRRDQNYLEIPQLQEYDKNPLILQDNVDINNFYSEFNKVENMDLCDILENWSSENLNDSFTSHFLNFIAGQ